MILKAASFKTGTKTKRASKAHSGYVDEGGQTYLPPANPRKHDFWKAQMVKKGFVFS